MVHLYRFIALLLAFSCGHPASGQTPSLKNDRLHRLDSVLTVLHQRQQFNGVVLVGEKGKVTFKKAYGTANKATGTNLTTASAFNLASVSKQFVSMAIMMLVETGKLRYDDTVSRYLPEIKYPVTLRNLLTHTSGLPEYFDLVQRYLPAADTVTNTDVLQLLANYHPELAFQPGEQFEYCNTNYVLLASVVERVSGQTMADFLRQRIFVPLKMKDTYVYHLRMPVSPTNRVFGFRYEGNKLLSDDLIRFDGIVGDGNVYASAEDLWKWDQALYTEKLVKKVTLAQAFTPFKLHNDSLSYYGFGWGLAPGGKLVSHTGSWAGFRTYIRRNLEHQHTLIVLENAGHGGLSLNKILAGEPFLLPRAALIHHIRLVDGTGAPARLASVRIRGERIADVGDLQPLAGEEVTDGHGLVLSPGFIDTHSHHDGGIREQPAVLAAVSQGITTIVVGQDGFSHYPLKQFFEELEKKSVAVNVASYVGHNTLRRQVMGPDDFRRLATAEEIKRMKELLRQELATGALGLSSGLEYDPGIFSNRDEVLELAKVAAQAHSRYISHMRSEDVALEEALEEIIAIGREAKLPVQISHFKIGMKGKWGMAPQLLAALQQARAEGIEITADVYPYEYWQSTMTVLFPKRDFTNRASAEFALRELAPADGIVLADYAANPAYVGKTIAQIASERHEAAADTYLKLIADAQQKNAGESIIAKSMSEVDIAALLAWPHTNVCSDGAISGHPRGYGTFPRVLGQYVREKKVLSLETAVYKMTALAAEHVGIRQRGVIAPGYFADLVLFDPATVQDHATIQDAKALSTGIAQVWVNGQSVYKNQQATGSTPSKVIKR